MPRPESRDRRRPVQPIPDGLYPPGRIPPGAYHVRRAPWQTPRWWEWCELRHLICPAGHHLKNTRGIDQSNSARVRCGEWLHDERAECGLWIWATRLHGNGHIVIETTERDLPQLRQLRDPTAVIAHFGVFAQLARVR